MHTKKNRSRQAVNHTDAKRLPAKRTRNGSKRRAKKEGAALEVRDKSEGEFPRLVSFLDEATRRPWLIVAMAVAFAILCALGIWCVS